MFKLMRERMKVIVIIVAVAFVATLLYAGGASFFGGGGNTVNAASVALVNGKEISYVDFYQAYYSIVRQQEMYGQPIRGQMISQAQYYALDQLVNQQLLIQAAEDAKIKVDESLVNQQFEDIQSNFPSKAIFEEELKGSGLTTKELKEILRTNLKLEKLQEQILADIEVTETDLKNAYEEVNARHILIQPEREDDEARDAALAEAKQVMQEIEEGTDFAVAAEAYSADTGSKVNGGELGWFGRGRMVEPFEKAAFVATVGEIVGPVESQFGFHIIQVTDRKEAAGPEFEAAREELEGKIRMSKGQDKLMDWFRGLRDAAQIEIKDPAMQAYKLALEGAWAEAAAAYQAAILADEADPYLHSALAQVYEQQDELDLALEQYELAAEKAVTDAELWLVVGMMHQERENDEEAVKAYQQASDSDPMNLFLHLQLMDAYSRLGEDELVKVEESKITAIQELYQERQKAAEEMQRRAEEGQQSVDDSAKDTEEVESEGAESEEDVAAEGVDAASDHDNASDADSVDEIEPGE